jgi:XTP/dITP diphosphohydrolase
MKLLLATNNLHKKKEIQEILEPHTVLLPEDEGISFEFEETGRTYLENAYGKADSLFRKCGCPVIADDSGLSVPALGGEPGIYSSRYGSREAGRLLKQAERNRYLLEKMDGITDRRAFFVCCMVLVLEDFRFFTAQETVHGQIIHEPKGEGGFGYDPLFYLAEYGKTVAELPDTVKNEISHRGRAGLRIKAILDTLGEE